MGEGAAGPSWPAGRQENRQEKGPMDRCTLRVLFARATPQLRATRGVVRGTHSSKWGGFVRATGRPLLPPAKEGRLIIRRNSSGEVRPRSKSLSNAGQTQAAAPDGAKRSVAASRSRTHLPIAANAHKMGGGSRYQKSVLCRRGGCTRRSVVRRRRAPPRLPVRLPRRRVQGQRNKQSEGSSTLKGRTMPSSGWIGWIDRGRQPALRRRSSLRRSRGWSASARTCPGETGRSPGRVSAPASATGHQRAGQYSV